MILSNRNSFLSVTLSISRVHLPEVTRYHEGSLLLKGQNTDRMGRMKRGKPPIRPSRAFPGAWSRAARDCRYSNCPYEKLPLAAIAHLEQ